MRSQSRYDTFARPKSAPSIDDDQHKASKDYANFLKDTERKCGPDGFLDSRRYTNAFELHKYKKRQTGRKATTTPRLIDVSLDRVKYDQDYEKRLKAIEDCMWQAKQEERHLERSKRDVMKKQRDVRQMMKSWEQSVAKQSFEEDKKLSKGLEKYTTLQRNFSHRKIDLTKKRADNLTAMMHEQKDIGRKTQLNTSHLSRQYRDKMEQLRITKVEMDTLMRDFEEKLRRKEMEQVSLKKELETLSNDYYREALKGKQMEISSLTDQKKFQQRNIDDDRHAELKLDSQLKRGDGDVKGADMKKRRLSAQLSTTRSRIAIKKREEDRTLQSTRIKLDDNVSFQRKLNVDAKFANYDRQTKEIQHKIEEANARRINAATAVQLERKREHESKENLLSERAKEKHLEMQRRQHEDGLHHFQRCVAQGESHELQLHTKVKNAEYVRQKQEKEVRRLQQRLNALKRTNSRHLTIEIAEANKREKELNETIIRAKAELDKAHAEREESYFTLQSHRARLQEDKQILLSHRHENKRLNAIAQRSDSVAAH